MTAWWLLNPWLSPLQPSGPSVSLYLTLFGVVAGLFSTFWAFGYIRINRKLRAYLVAGPGADVPRIRKVGCPDFCPNFSGDVWDSDELRINYSCSFLCWPVLRRMRQAFTS